MRKAAIASLCGATLAIGSVTTAHTGQIRSFSVGSWKAGAYASDSTKKFTHCAGSARYRSGIIVTLVVNREYNWGVAFSHPDWNLRPESKLELAYVVDSGEPRATTATVLSEDQVMIGFGGNVDRFNEFSRGRELRVAAAKKVLTFNLTDTSKLLPALLKCVAYHINPPPAVASDTKPSAPKDRDAYRAEATVIVANLLSEAGISGFRVVSPKEIPEMKSDVAWVAGDVVGAITVFPEINRNQIDDVRSVVIGADAKACKGSFFSGSIPDDGKEASLTRVFTTCQSGTNTGTTYYLAVPRKAGGIYVFQTIGKGNSEKPAKDADASIRKAVFTALPQ